MMAKLPLSSVDVYRSRNPIRGSFAAQLVLDGYLKVQHSQVRWLRPLFKLAIHLLGKTSRLVRYSVDGTELVLPLSHSLPLIRAILPDALRHHGRIATYVASKYPSLTGIIVGADTGVSLAVIRAQTTFPILAIEPNHTQHRLLNRNTLTSENVETECATIGNDALPKVDVAPLDTPIITLSMSDILERHPRFTEARFLLLNMGGISPSVIDALVPYLETVQPILSIETTSKKSLPTPFLELIFTLGTIGYQYTLLFNEFGQFMASFELSNRELLEELHRYQLNAPQHGYTLTLFPSNDSDVARMARSEEYLRQ
jgi:hypothetical protein